MIGPREVELFRQICDGAEQFALVTHIQPDGDALGSEISLGRFLLDRGKRVTIVNHDPTSALLKFIDDPDLPIADYDPAVHDRFLTEVDRIVLVDNSAPDRLGRLEAPMLRVADRVFCIDHHPTRTMPWADHIVDVDACATASIIYDLTTACGWRPDDRAALAIYVGLATDTGSFRFNSTTAHAHRIAADLMELGVEPAKVYRAVYERNSEAFTRLLGHALTMLQLDSDGSVASVSLDMDLLRRLSAEDADTSEITTSLLAIDGVVVALLFRELSDGRIKVSLRSKGDLDVHRLAIDFGGGGHRNASGIVMQGTLDDVGRVVTERARQLLTPAS